MQFIPYHHKNSVILLGIAWYVTRTFIGMNYEVTIDISSFTISWSPLNKDWRHMTWKVCTPAQFLSVIFSIVWDHLAKKGVTFRKRSFLGAGVLHLSESTLTEEDMHKSKDLQSLCDPILWYRTWGTRNSHPGCWSILSIFISVFYIVHYSSYQSLWSSLSHQHQHFLEWGLLLAI